MPYSKPRTNTSWGNVASWYNEHLEQKPDTYQKSVILPNLLRLMDVKKAERILDLACGQGFFSRELAKLGAKVTAADVSEELVALAQQQDDDGIAYLVTPADDLSAIKDASQHKILVSLALQNMQSPDKVLKECGRVLKKGGSMHIVLNHPSFRIPKESGWGWDEETFAQYRRVNRYMSENKVPIRMKPGSDPTLITYSFHRPLQTWFKWLVKAGFCVNGLEEWISDRVSDSGPRAKAENLARKEIPLFMYIRAEKV